MHCKVVGQRDAQFIAGALVPQYNISFDQSTPAAPLLEFVQNMLKGPGNHFTPPVDLANDKDKKKQKQTKSSELTICDLIRLAELSRSHLYLEDRICRRLSLRINKP